MLNRWIGIVCAIGMLAANATLFVRDILPNWRAGEAPPQEDFSAEFGERREQVGIYTPDGELFGRSWTVSTLDPVSLEVTSLTLLFPAPLAGGVLTPEMRVETTLRYTRPSGMLDELTMLIHGLSKKVRLHGEHMEPDEFACKWQVGLAHEGAFVLSAEETRAFSDVLRPFSRLHDLYVGRTWQLNLVNPLNKVLPGLSSETLLEAPELARVTGMETIEHRGARVESFVVEANRLRAWVARDGTVLLQEIELPLLGRLSLRDEAFDEAGYRDAQGTRAAP